MGQAEQTPLRVQLRNVDRFQSVSVAGVRRRFQQFTQLSINRVLDCISKLHGLAQYQMEELLSVLNQFGKFKIQAYYQWCQSLLRLARARIFVQKTVECLLNFVRQIRLLAIFLDKLMLMEPVQDQYRRIVNDKIVIYFPLLTDYVVGD